MFRRRLFYLSGFDPRGVRFYHGLAREQLAAHAACTGEAITVSARAKGQDMAIDWTVENATSETVTRQTFLRWDDIVARSWVKGAFQLGWQTVACYWRYVWRTDWRSYWRLAKGPCISMVYPVVFTLLLPLLLGLPVALIVAWLLPAWLHPVAVGLLIGLAAGIAAARPILDRLRAFWLIRLFIVNDRYAREGFGDEVMARVDGFARQIAAALDDDDDEVLLIAHSKGTLIAVPLLLRLLELRGGVLPAKFTYVTMGHCMPILTCRRDASEFHAQLRALSGFAFPWVDIGAPGDGAGCHGVVPLEPAAGAGRIALTLLSPRFHIFRQPENYNSGLANKYEFHFDYLRCGDRVSPIDLPSLTVSARPIAHAVAAFRDIP